MQTYINTFQIIKALKCGRCYSSEPVIEGMLNEHITSKLKIVRIKKGDYKEGIKSKETRPGWGEAHNVYKAYHGGVLSQYVHFGYITQVRIHVASAHFTL